MSLANWVKLRLPSGVSFSKNGVTQTVDQAVAAALADHPETRGEGRALADLLRIVASEQLFKHEKDGDYEYDTSLLESRALYWEEWADAGEDLKPGTFQSIPATFQNAAPDDEYSS